jgi:predicted Zn-ribbon and HTH transcriptional regulator
MTVREETLERAKDHRGEAHESWDDALNGMMDMLPEAESIQSGCDFVDCDESHIYSGKPEETGGVIQFFYSEEHDLHGVRYFCSPECAKRAQERVNSRMPRNPDEVIVGGRGELRTSFGDATYDFEGRNHSVLIPVPGAFGGESSHDRDYDYVGEPLYIKNDGDIVQMYAIEEVIHEETSTILVLGKDYEVQMLNHPDDAQRELYEEEHAKIEEGECASCGWRFHYKVKEPPEECPSCGAEEW